MLTQSTRRTLSGILAGSLLACGTTLWIFAAKPVNQEMIDLARVDTQTSWIQEHNRNSVHHVQDVFQMTPEERMAAFNGTFNALGRAEERDLRRTQQAMMRQIGAAVLCLLSVFLGIRSIHSSKPVSASSSPEVETFAVLRQRKISSGSNAA